jgi:hypothetical protein
MHRFPFFLVLVSVCILCSTAAAAEISAGNVALDGIGQTATVPITLDKAADGLAGYTLDISVADPSVAEIVAVDYPGWASLSQSGSLPAGEVRLKAVDINREVQAGATNIPLATVTVKSQSAGITSLQVSPVRINDDKGGGIPSSPVERALTVTGPVTPSGGTGGGSPGGSTGGASSGGSAEGSTAVSGSAYTITGSTGTSSKSSSPGEQTVQPVHTPDSWVTAPPTRSQPSGTTQETGEQAAPVSTPSGNGLDWIRANLFPAGIAVVAVVVILLFAGTRMLSSHSRRW